MEATPISAMTRRGVALYRAGRDSDAVAALRRAAGPDQAPEPAAWQYLAASLWRSRQPSEALALLGEAVLAHPDEAWPWRHLGAALLAAGRGAEARYALDEALLADPNDRVSADLLAQTPPPAEHCLGSEPPSPDLADSVAGLGILALGLLRRAQPGGPLGWRLVISLLGRLSPALAEQRLAELAASKDSALRLAAASIVAELAPAVAEELALGLLADETPEVRAAVRPAVLAGAAEDVPALTRLLAHADPVVRHETVAELASQGDAEPLRRVYVASDEPKVRRECLRGFGQMGQSDLLALVLWDEVGALRAEAARLLAERPADEAAAALRDRIEAEPDEYVRGIMASSLGALEPADEPETWEEDDAPNDGGSGADDGGATWPGHLG